MRRVTYILLFIILIVGLTIDAFSQRIVASLDLDRKEPRPLWFEYCKADKGLVTLSTLGTKNDKLISLIKYDAQFKRQWYKEIFENNDRKNIEHLAVLGNKIVVLVSERFRKESRKELYCYVYDLTGTPMMTGASIFTLNGEDDDSNLMSYTLSINKKKLLLFERVHVHKKPAGSAQILILDADTDEIKRATVTLPANSDELILKTVKITNEGDVILLSRLGKDERLKEKTDIKYRLSRYNAPDYRAQHLSIEYDDVYITDLNLKPDRDGNLMLGGFFSNKNANLAGGVLFLKVERSTHEIMIQNRQNFSKEFLANYLSPRQIERGRELNDFYLDEMILRSDGGMLFIAEQYYLSATTYRDIYGFWYNRNVYHFDDVVVFSLSPEGEIEWHSVVSKSQSGETDTELSYLGLVGSEYLYILYRTKIKGLGTNIFVSRIEYDGKASHPEPFFDKISPNDIFYRSFSEQISNDEAIIAYYTAKTKTFSLAKVVF